MFQGKVIQDCFKGRRNKIILCILQGFNFTFLMFLSLRQQENALVTVPSNGMSVINISHVSESKTFFHSVFAFQICVKSWTEFYTSELRYSLISFWCCCSRPDQVTNVTTHRFSSRKLPFLFPAVRGNTKWPELVLGCRTMWNVQLLGHSHRIL